MQCASKYERGVMLPTMELIVRIAKAFEVSVDFLIRDGRETAVDKIKSYWSSLRRQMISLTKIRKQWYLFSMLL